MRFLTFLLRPLLSSDSHARVFLNIVLISRAGCAFLQTLCVTRAHVPRFCFPVPAFLYKFLFFVVQDLHSRASRAFQILLTFLRGKYFRVPHILRVFRGTITSPRSHLRVISVPSFGHIPPHPLPTLCAPHPLSSPPPPLHASTS